MSNEDQTAETPDPIVLEWWGEDGDYLAAPGHVDLSRFAELADAEYALQTGVYDEPISVDFPAEHKWFVSKPIEHDDCDEGYFPCEAGTPGALAFTVIETGV